MNRRSFPGRHVLRVALLGLLASIVLCSGAPAALAASDITVTGPGRADVTPGRTGQVQFTVESVTGHSSAKITLEVVTGGRYVTVQSCGDCLVTFDKGISANRQTVYRPVAVSADAPGGQEVGGGQILVDGVAQSTFRVITPQVVGVPLVPPVIGGVGVLALLAGGWVVHRRRRAPAGV